MILLKVLNQKLQVESEKLKQCFYQHHEMPQKSWSNYAQELISYFTTWITELGFNNFDQYEDSNYYRTAKVLIACGNKKKHFLDNCLNSVTPLDLSKKLDDYENIKESFKNKELPKKTMSNFRPQFKN